MRLTRSLVPVLLAAAGLAAPLAIAPTAHAAAVTCAGLKATIVGNDRGNTITGTAEARRHRRPRRQRLHPRAGGQRRDLRGGGRGQDPRRRG